MMSIQAIRIDKYYGKVEVLREVSIEVRDGEFLSVVGPSGCGKTTFLRIIAGFTATTRGRILLDEKDVTMIPARRRGIGMVFQHYALFPNLTVDENIAFGLRVRRTPQDELEQKVASLLHLVHMDEKRDRYPQELSGGQQQRVAVARALAVSPKVLLLDEPLSALDAQVRLELRYELKRIQREAGITAIYVTHDQEEALSISDRVAVMEEGRICQLDAPRGIYLRPRSRFVAQFVGVSNLFEVETLSGTEGTVRWRNSILYVPPYKHHKPDSGRALVAVRPEGITIAHPADSCGPAGEGVMLSGIVLDQVFLGATVRFAVDLQGQIVYADLQNIEGNSFQSGDEIQLWIGRSAAHIIL